MATVGRGDKFSFTCRFLYDVIGRMVSVFVVPVVCLNRSSPYFFQKLSIASLSVYDVAGWIKSTAPAVEPGRSCGWDGVVLSAAT
jgi:hypothetical protein